MNRRIVLSGVFLLSCGFLLAEDSEIPKLEPANVNCERIAFFPKRWQEAGADFDMLAWEGKQIVLITKKGKYDRDVVSAFVDRLDQGWLLYHDLVGVTPRLMKQFAKKPTICAIPKSNLSCGFGCGYVGSTGIEVSAFYSRDLPDFQRQQGSFKHYYFYEMGRNYFVFGDRHNLFTTGYAVFMRYVCMDALECVDIDRKTRATIEWCEQVYADSDIGFFDAFTNLGRGEKRNRLRQKDGRLISPSDQPVMYATAMLKLRKDYGGDKFVRTFYHTLHDCEPRAAKDIESASTQCYNWLVCASVAARKDLTPVFVDRWRMPFTDAQRNVMKEVDWDFDDISARDVVSQLLAAVGEK